MNRVGMRETPSAWLVTGGMRSLGLIALALVMSLSVGPVQQASAATPVPVTVDTSEGYGRLLFDLPPGTDASASLNKTVLVIRFSRPVEVDTRRLGLQTDRFVAMIREDADKRAIRMALTTPLQLTTSRRGNQIAIDLLPIGFRGPLPTIAPPPAPVEPPPQTADVTSDSAALDAAAEGLASDEAVGEAEPAPAEEAAEDPALSPLVGPLETLPIQVSANDHFTRVLFRWPERVAYAVQADEGEITVHFDRPARARLAPLTVDPPRPIADAVARNDRSGLSVTIAVLPGTVHRHHRDDDGVVLDLISGEAAKAVEEGKAKVERAPGQEPAQPAPQSAAATPAPEPALAETETKPDPAPTVEVVQRPPPEPEVIRPGPPPEPSADAPLRVGVLTDETGVTLSFPFGQGVPAAIFRRADYLWIAFEAARPLDVSAVQPEALFELSQADLIPHPSLSVLRLLPVEGALISAVGDESGWRLTIGETITDLPQRLTLRRLQDTSNGSRVEIPFAGVSAIQRIVDPEVGDELAVATGLGPVRGLAKPRRMAEFHTLQSFHGVAIDPIRDDLIITRIAEKVVITSPNGLVMSDAGAETVRALATRSPTDFPAAINYELWKGDLAIPFLQREQMLRAAVAANDAELADPDRLALARFYLANAMAPEATGMLSLMKEEKGLSGVDPHVIALKGVAAVKRGHYAEAADALAQRGLQDDPHAALWRSFALKQIRQYDEALLEFRRGSEVIDQYPAEWRDRMLLAAAVASVRSDDLKSARSYLKAIRPQRLLTPLEQERRFVEALILSALGKHEEALAFYDLLVRTAIPPIAAKANFERIKLSRSIGALSDQDAVDQLEAMRFQWRGDDLEFDVHEELASAYCGTGAYRACLGVYERVQRHFPNHPRSREAWKASTDVFRELFLQDRGKTMPPVQALALFYDYKKLTPIGREGDEMIRALSDRLVEIDLLPQAADLLRHQVDNRLQGVAKAQVANRLASIYLMDRKPEEALRTLRDSRQARLPNELAHRRQLLEARAMAAIGRFDHGLEILVGNDTLEAERLRAAIHWQAEDWSSSADLFERLADQAWREATAVGEQERAYALRAAIAYALGGDAQGLERVRLKFATGMAESADARAFQIVTDRIDREGTDFQALAREIANVDLLEAFMEDVRAGGAFSEPLIN